MSASEQHLRTQLEERRIRYDVLTKRIAALDVDISREVDSLRSQVLEERRFDLASEREQVSIEIGRLEQKLSDAKTPHKEPPLSEGSSDLAAEREQVISEIGQLEQQPPVPKQTPSEPPQQGDSSGEAVDWRILLWFLAGVALIGVLGLASFKRFSYIVTYSLTEAIVGLLIFLSGGVALLFTSLVPSGLRPGLKALYGGSAVALIALILATMMLPRPAQDIVPPKASPQAATAIPSAIVAKPGMEMNFWAEQEVIGPGECATLRWDVESVNAVFLEGGAVDKVGVGGHDSRKVCPASTTTYTLIVEATGQTHQLATTVWQSSDLPIGNIVFTSDREGEWRVFQLDLSSGHVTQLTNGANRDSSPTYDWDPSGSPDGRTVVFESGREGEFDVYTLKLNDSQLVRLTSDSASNLTPAWSSVNGLIAYQSLRNGNFDIYSMTSDGRNVKRLTDHPGPDLWPSWSPDGTQILFESYRHPNGKAGLYVMEADGTNVVPIMQDDTNSGQPSWSIQGRIAFYSDRAGNKDVFILNRDGSGLKQVTFDASEDWFPAWSPDGRWLAFTSNRDGHQQIYVADPDRGIALRVTHDTSNNRDPAWLTVP